ncbi:Arginyl-tRNA--protein transferase 1 [Elasticomyces elasticus]|nr:Arginyl-tRNA--protein transferase 1 [Elasticomyces elasticus]
MFPAPLEAVASGLSLLELGMPGVMSSEEIALQLDLDEVRLLLRGAVHRMKDLVSWDGGSVVDSSSLKGLVAEFVACIGPKLAREVLVSFS